MEQEPRTKACNMGSVADLHSNASTVVPEVPTLDEKKNEIPAAALLTVDPEAPVKTPVPPIDGTRDGWLTVLGGFMGLFGSFGFLNA